MTPLFLETAHLYLRPLTPEDADGPYLRWFNDAEVCKYNSHFVFPYRREAALAFVIQAARSEKELVLAIILRSDNRHIGNIALENIDMISRSAEFAIVIGERDCWGKGYSREAAEALVRHGFDVLNLNRIYCGTPVDNVPMRRLAEALGMQQEGIRRQAMFKNGRYMDVVEYGVLRLEFFAATGLGE